MKYLLALAGLLAVVCLVLILVTVKVMPNEGYRRLAVWGISQLTDYRMVAGGDFEVDWSQYLSFTATDLRFEPKADAFPPALRTIGRLHTRIKLAPLLRGILLIDDLKIEGLQLIRVEGMAAEDSEFAVPWPLSHLTPVVVSVAFNDLHFDFRDTQDRRHKVLLRHLTIDDIDDQGPLFLQGHGQLNTAQFQMSGQMGGTLALYEKGRPYPIALELDIAGLKAALTGTIDHPFEGQGFNLKLAIEEQELADLLNVLGHDVPPLGCFTFEAAITGDIKALSIRDLDIQVSNGSTIHIGAAGSVPDLSTGKGTDIQITQDIESNGLLAWFFPEDWDTVEALHLNAALRNIDGRYVIEGIDAWVANDKGIVFNAEGRLTLGNPFQELLVTAIDLDLNLTSPNTAGIKPFLTDAIPEIGGVVAQARLVGPIDHLALEDLYVDRGGSGPVQVTTRGRIGRIPLSEDEPLEEIDFTFSIQAEDSLILRRFYEIPLGELGAVDLTGRINGSSRRFKLQDVKLHTQTEEGLETRVTGGIDFKPYDEGGVIGDLGFKLIFDSPTLGIAEPLLGLQIMRPLGPIHGEADVTGTTREMTFENIIATAGDPDRLYADWQGRIKRIPLVKGGVSSGYETHGTLYAAHSSDFAALFGIALADVGPVRGSWRDTDREGVLGMADIKVAIGDGQHFNLTANGKIDNLVDQNKYKYVEEERIEYAGIDFQFDLQTADTHGLAKLVGMTMPDLGAVKGAWRLTGSERRLAIKEARLESVAATGLKIIATGEVPQIDVGPGADRPEFEVQFNAQAPHIAAIPGLEAANFPMLGDMAAEALLKYRKEALDLEAIQIRTGPADQPTLVVEGQLFNFDAPQRTSLTAQFTTGARPWLEYMLKRGIEANPQMIGTLELGRFGDDLRINRFDLQADDMGGLAMEGTGTLTLTDQNPHVDLQIHTEVADPAAWGDVMALPVPPLAATRITGWYRDEANQHQFSGDVRIGDSRFQATFRGTTHDSKPVVEATLAAQTLQLEDLGFYPAKRKAASPAAPQSRKKAPSRLFTEEPLALSALDEIDLDLKILADEIVARENVFKNVGIDIAIHDGRLQIGPSTVKYLQGTSSISAFIDTTGTIPVLSLNLTVEDADIQELLTSLNRPLVLGGKLTAFIDVHSAGWSAREIAANLAGETAFAIEKGQIQRKIELLSSDALDFLFTGPASQTYTDLDCTAFRMFFDDGTGNVQVFFVETPGMRAEAFGQIDLNDETINLIINATAKRRFFRRSSPARVSGPLQDPSITKVPAAEAAILAGQVLVPVVALPARALGFLWSMISRDEERGDCFIAPDGAP
jgi:uncharacterized protein involved in outer membrane biogenesis